MMPIFDIEYILGHNGEDLGNYMPYPCDGISFYEVKEFIRKLSNEYRQRFSVTIWTPNTNPSDDDTVRVLETINADEFYRQFRHCGYNRARMFIESTHDVK